jgi:hypothetical protein
MLKKSNLGTHGIYRKASKRRRKSILTDYGSRKLLEMNAERAGSGTEKTLRGIVITVLQLALRVVR